MASQATSQATPGSNDGAILELFFSLIQCGIGKRDTLPRTPDAAEWEELFELSKKQTLAGIAFAGIERLPGQQRPPKEILLPWYRLCGIIRKKNAELNSKSAAVSRKFKSEGFPNCILKGQGLAQLYPDPTLRTPGDIDIWLDGGCDKAIAYVKRYFPECNPTYHHVDFPITPHLEIEIHYRPTWMYNPFTNKRLQQYFNTSANKEFTNTINTPEGDIPTPTLAFNRIYVMLHIYRHLFFEGIGLRQVLDYYYIMQQGMSEKEKAEYISAINRLGLNKFAGALMYVMQRIFALDDAHTPVKPNTKLGKFVLHEIMIAGNFGRYDPRYRFGENKYSLKRVTETIKRNYTLLTRFPNETLWSPYFKLWHYFWRKRHK